MKTRSFARWGTLLVMALMLLAGCGGTSSDFGGNANHVHDMVVLRDHAATVLVASHIGLYRSTDHGQSWVEAAGGSGQPMDGLMLFKLAVSQANPSHVFLLAGPRPDDRAAARDVPGIYASTDSGATWRRASTTDPFGGSLPFTVIAGAGSGDHLYALRQEQSTSTLYESTDGAAHWAQLPQLPISTVNGVVADPAKPGRLYVYSVSTGLYVSGDNGAHWQAVPALKDGIFGVSIVGQTVWAEGDTGLFISTDGGESFSAVSTSGNLSIITPVPENPKMAWGVSGQSVSLTSDSGAHWRRASEPPHQPGVLFAPNGHELWSSGSYPLSVAHTADAGASWQTLLG